MRACARSSGSKLRSYYFFAIPPPPLHTTLVLNLLFQVSSADQLTPAITCNSQDGKLFYEFAGTNGEQIKFGIFASSVELYVKDKLVVKKLEKIFYNSCTGCMMTKDHECYWHCTVPLALHTSIAQLRTPLEEAGVQWHQSGSASEPLEQLFDLLIRPIQGVLDELAPSPDQLLVFIPHAELTRVPFAALRNRDRPENPWLIERHTIAVAPSMRVLRQCTQWWYQMMDSRPSLAGSLVVGNPSPMPFHNSQLPEAEKEAQSLATKLR